MSSCSLPLTRAPHLLLEPSAGRFSVRLFRFTLTRAGETMRIDFADSLKLDRFITLGY